MIPTFPKNLTRKQRELQQREAQILMTARQLLIEHGYLGLTMDKIAEAMEYSKGTIYQHFSCKEEVVAHLCLSNMNSLCNLFERANAFNGRSRERLSGIMVAYALHSFACPGDFANIQLIKTSSLREKISEESREKMASTELYIQKLVAQPVYDAIAKGELQLNRVTPEELVFGLWSMCYGGLLVLLAAPKFSFDAPHKKLRYVLEIFLDGLNWRDLSTDFDYTQSYKRICDEVLADEIASLPPASQEMFHHFLS